MKDRRTLFARLTRPDGAYVEIMHTDSLGIKCLINVTKARVITRDIPRIEVYKLIARHRTKFNVKVTVWFGCRKVEYVNIHTGKREKLWGT